MFLQVEQASIRYPRSPAAAVENVSLGLAAGELGVLVGPSGSGKTSLLRAIAGLEPLQAGRIHLDARLLEGDGIRVLAEQRQIGMVFQDFALFPHLTVGENIAFGLRGQHKPTRQARVAGMLALVGLQDAAATYPHQLSGGQQQRIALARALAPHPRLLLLDEPFSSLDVELRERLAADVRAILKATGTTALMVTHDQMEAFTVGDVVGVMNQGRLEQWSAAAQLYHQPATRFVADFIGHGVLLQGQVRQRKMLPPEAAAQAGLAGQCEQGKGCELGMRVTQWTPGTPGMQVTQVTQGTRLEVQTAAGIVEIAENIDGTEDTRGTLDAGAGTTVNVLLRAEEVTADECSPIKARVVHKSFRGATFLYTLELADGQPLLSLMPSRHDHAIGSWIGIGIAPGPRIAFGPSQQAASHHGR